MRVRDDGTIELTKPTFTTITELAGIGRKFQQSPAEPLSDEEDALDTDYATMPNAGLRSKNVRGEHCIHRH